MEVVRPNLYRPRQALIIHRHPLTKTPNKPVTDQKVTNVCCGFIGFGLPPKNQLLSRAELMISFTAHYMLNLLV